MAKHGRQVFLDSLRLHGADRIFGNPGTTETPLLDTLRDYPDIEYVVALHEGVAVGAASFHAQATGRTAVANMHVAPGLGNAIGMIYGALKANSPLIVTAGAQDTRMRLRNPVLGHDLVAMAEPVTKWSVQVQNADEMGPILQRAFKIANEEPKGPVFVALPINVMEELTEVPATAAGETFAGRRIDDAGIGKLAALLGESASPGIVVSDDVARSGAFEAVVALSEKAGAAVYSEILSVHVDFPSDHPHYRGTLAPDHAGVRKALGGHDLVLLLGGPFFEEVWYTPDSPFADGAKVVQVEGNARALAFNFPLTLGLHGDMADALTRVVDRLEDSPAAAKRRDELGARKAAEESKAGERLKALWDRTPMTPARALHELASALPREVVVAEEAITAIGDVTRNFRYGLPGDAYAGRGGGIGQGVAGAIGVAAAHPDRQVVAISGDGSAMYSIQSLWSAAHHGMKILFVILANREYRILKHNTDQYRRRFEVASNSPYPYMDLSRPVLDFVSMAKGMGVPARQVARPEEIGEAVREALAHDGPALIELVVEGMEFRNL